MIKQPDDHTAERLFGPLQERARLRTPGPGFLSQGTGAMRRGPEKIRVRPALTPGVRFYSLVLEYNSVHDDEPDTVFAGDASTRMGDIGQDVVGDTGGQLSNVSLKGINAGNSTLGETYWELTQSAGMTTLDVFSDAAHTNLVGTGSLMGDGHLIIDSVGGSGLTGSVDVVYTADDTDVGNTFNTSGGQSNAEYQCFMRLDNPTMAPDGFIPPIMSEDLVAIGFSTDFVTITDTVDSNPTGRIGFALVYEDWDPATLTWNNKPTSMSLIIRTIEIDAVGTSATVEHTGIGFEAKPLDFWISNVDLIEDGLSNKQIFGICLKWIIVGGGNIASSSGGAAGSFMVARI